MRVEISDHAVEGAVDQFFIGNLFGVNIALADSLKHAGEQFDLFEAGVFVRFNYWIGVGVGVGVLANN